LALDRVEEIFNASASKLNIFPFIRGRNWFQRQGIVTYCI